MGGRAGPAGRGHIEYLIVDQIAAVPRVDADGLSGWRVRPLSEDRDGGGGASFLADVAPCWVRRATWFCPSTLEILVLRGELALGDARLVAGDYARIPAGGLLPPQQSLSGATLFVTCDGAPPVPAGEQAGSPVPAIQSFAATPWQAVPGYEGRSLAETVPGMEMRVLREGGAQEPYTYLVRCPPGWADPREESHVTWEELFLLKGDYLMGDFGRLEAGSYIFRPGTVPHGPQATAHGSVFLARGERRIDFCFRPLAQADAAIAAYRAHAGAPAPAWLSWL